MHRPRSLSLDTTGSRSISLPFAKLLFAHNVPIRQPTNQSYRAMLRDRDIKNKICHLIDDQSIKRIFTFSIDLLHIYIYITKKKKKITKRNRSTVREGLKKAKQNSENNVFLKKNGRQRKISRYLSDWCSESQQKWTAMTSKAPRARFSTEANNRAVVAMARLGLKASDNVSDGHLLTQHSRIVAARNGYRLNNDGYPLVEENTWLDPFYSFSLSHAHSIHPAAPRSRTLSLSLSPLLAKPIARFSI